MGNKGTCLVTGAAGFMGSHVAERLAKSGYVSVALDDLSGGFKRNVAPECVFVEGSVTDEALLDRLFEEYRFTHIFHLAAYAAEGLSHFIRKFNYENNLIGSINLINRAVKYKTRRFVFTSSIAVYGSNQTPMVESLTPMPEDPYGIAKFAVEMDLKMAHEMFGLDYTIFRPHNVYGERQNHGDPYRNVLGIFINQIMLGKPLTIFGDGMQTRAFTHIDDVAPHIARCIEMPETANEIYNIGADKPYTVLELAETITDIMGAPKDFLFQPPRLEVVHAFANHDKVNTAFSIKETIGLREGIERMIDWSRDIGPQPPTKFGNIELPFNMPPSWQRLVDLDDEPEG